MSENEIKSVSLTKQGYDKMKDELEKLINIERPKAIEMVSYGRSLGDLSENAEYHSARERQSKVESRIQYLTSALSKATIIDPSKILDKSKAYVGSYVVIEDESTNEKKSFQLVSDIEADFNNGLLSIESPLGSLILGKGVGEFVDLTIKSQEKSFVIKLIDYK